MALTRRTPGFMLPRAVGRAHRYLAAIRHRALPGPNSPVGSSRRGVQAREQVIKAALYGVLQDESEVERIFLIIKQP